MSSSGTGTAIVTCRGCLAVGVKLYNIKQSRLVDNYVQLVGISVQDHFTQVLCSICVRMLQKFAAFRDKCSRSYQFLVDAESQGKSISRLKLPYTLTETQVLDYVGINENEHDFLREIIPTHQAKDNEDYVLQATGEGLLYVAECDESKDKIEDVNKEIDKEHFETFYLVDNVVDKPMDENDSDEDKDNKPSVDDNVIDEEIGADASDEETIDNLLEPKKEVDKNTNSKKKQIIKPTTDEEINVFGKSYGFSVKFLTEEEQYEEIEQRKLSVKKPALKCELCGQSCSTQSLLKKHHEKCHNKSNKFLCKFCQTRCSAKYILTKHLIMHKILFSCKQCPLTTKRVDFLYKHYLTHIGKKYKCEYCDSVFGKQSSYACHIRFQHASVLPWCELCGLSFLNKNGVMVHKNQEHSGEKADFSCEECSAKFCSKEALGKHVGLEQCGRASCVRCGEGFPNEQMLRFHLISHQGDAMQHPCEACGVNFNNKMALKKHERACGRAVPCVQCGDHFEDEAAMLEHVTSEHNAANGFKCPECGRTFPNAVHYKSHISNAHDYAKRSKTLHVDANKRFECDYCHLKLRKKYDMMNHIALHSGALPFKCALCHRKFPTKIYLKRHMRAHSDIKPYQCDICKHSYKQKGNLKKHQIIHSDVKPHACTQCDWRFKTLSELKMHSAKHTDEKLFKCDYCEQKFKYGDGLTRHMSIHAGERPHKCTECTRRYSRRFDLKNHIKNVHGMHMPRGSLKVKNFKAMKH